MADSDETDTVVRTFDREIDRLKSNADTMRRANRGSAPTSDRATITASSGDTVEGAWAAPITTEPATTISAALGGGDATGVRPLPLFLGGSTPGPDGFRIGGAAGGAGHDLWTLLTLRDLLMSSFVPERDLRIGGKDKPPGR